MDDRKNYGAILSSSPRHLLTSLPDSYRPLSHSPASRSVSQSSVENHNDGYDDPNPGNRSASTITKRSVSTTAPSLSTSTLSEGPLLFTNPLLCHPDKSYIKLEVISAKEVRSLLVFFSWFVIAAFLYTILLLIAANTTYQSLQEVPIAPQYLTEEQKEAATIIPKAITEEAHSNEMFDDNKVLDLGSVAVSDDINPNNFFYLISARVAVLPRVYKLVSYFSNIFLAVFFFVLSILFAIRVFSEGKRRTTHEQIWVLVLMLSTSLYFSAFESIIRVFEELNKEVHRKFAAWVFRIEDVFTVLREASFAVVTFFYIWANLHSYRILDPLKRLTFRGFYLPKLLLLAPLSVFIAVTYTVIPVLLTQIPLFAAPVFVFLFSDFRIITALRAELAAAIVKSIVDLILLTIIVFEARKAFKVLEEVPYMKHRTKRVGIRFFLYINSLYYVLFFILQFMLLFGKPKGDNFVTLNPEVGIVHAGLFHYWTPGPNILLAGYVLVTAYVHLPRTSVDVFSAV